MDDLARLRMAEVLHHRKPNLAKGDPVVPAVTLSTTFHLPEVQGAAHIYGRNGNPVWDAVEAQLGLIEDAEVVSFPSGMAAITAALMASLGAGRRVILPGDGYYVTRLLGRDVLRPYGVEVVEVPTLDIVTADFTKADVVYIETPSNPGLDLIDIRAVVTRAHAAGAKVIVDNTTMTGLLQRPLDLGADLVVAADTKAPAGHSDALFGHVSGRDSGLIGRIREWRRQTGAIPGPFEAYLVHRGIETLELRLSRMCASARIIAERLQATAGVFAVRYPGLPGDPGHELACRQMLDFGFLIGFQMESRERAERFLSECPYLAQATSFGSTHSAGECRARWGDLVAPGFIRLSVGIEPVEVLWSAIAGALAV